MTRLGLAGALVAATLFHPIGAGDLPGLLAAGVSAQQQSDTATLRLHISGMTCGTCPAAARMAVKKLSGVISATVTYDDSLGVVRYDPARVTPAQITAHLTKLTGYRATILPDAPRSLPTPRGRPR